MIILMSNLTSDSHPLAIQYQTPMATDLPQETEFQPISHNLDTRVLYKQDLRHCYISKTLRHCYISKIVRHCYISKIVRHCYISKIVRHCYISKIVRHYYLSKI